MSDTILVADGDAVRGRRVAAACRALGIETRVVTHGAAALEIALAEKPAAMVAQVALPLIDGTRLADILHANPHTRSMGMLFIGDDTRDGAARDAHSGRVIPGHADPDTIARFIQALLRKRRPEPHAPAAGRDAPGVEGKLSQIALSELIELFHVNRKTGVIELRQRGGRRAATGRITLRDGDVIQAQTGSVEGEKALYRLLAWRRGSFAFREDAVDERASIERPTRALLREAQRQADETEIGSELPAAHARVALKVARSSLPNVLHPLTQEVLLALELSGRVQDVLDRCSFPDYQVLRTLQTLIRRGMVELRADTAGPETPAAGLFAPALVARLRDWLEQGRPRDAAPLDAKVVLIASQPEARRALISLLARLPGVEHTPRGEVAGVWPTLRIAVDEEVAIELIEVPAAARFAPVWPIAAHGALATIFVHGGGVDASVAALRPAIDEIAALPRTRCFHLLVEEKDPQAVRTLCERLALYDDRSVLVVSPERPDAAAASLRELLARLLP
jgi:CheY-like chemotaxis protein